MKDNIFKSAFITLLSTFFLVGLIITMITNGTQVFSISVFLKNFNIVNEHMNLYDKLVRVIIKDNYDQLTQFEKEFFFSGRLMEVIKTLTDVGSIPIIGWLLEGLLVSLIATMSAVVFIVELLIKTLTLVVIVSNTIIYTLTGEIIVFA